MKNLTVTVNGVAYNVTVEENTNGAAPGWRCCHDPRSHEDGKRDQRTAGRHHCQH